MANKLTDRNEITINTLVDTDVIHVVDVSDSTQNVAGSSFKCTVGELRNVLGRTASMLFTNPSGTGNTQMIINKGLVGDTASQLFQTGFSGRAEFGLTGDDEFRIKVSPNGSTWYDAIVIDKDNGNINIQQGLSFDGGSTTLDQYEEGSWAPTYQAASGSPTITYAIQEGRYTRIGNMVTVWGRISTNSFVAAGSAAMRIGGLPFTVANTSSLSFTGSVGLTQKFIGATNNPCSVFANDVSTYLDIYKQKSADGRDEVDLQLLETDMSTGTSSNTIQFSCSYQI